MIEAMDQLARTCGYALDVNLNEGTRGRTRVTVWCHHPTAQPGYEYHRVASFTSLERAREWLLAESARIREASCSG